MFYTSGVPEIDVNQLAIYLQSNTDSPLQLIDVRERNEVAIAALEGFKVLPLSEFSQWSEDILTRLDADAETIVMCHHGMRSAQLCQWLINQGFTNVKNVVGGIDAYARFIDPNIARY
ncbi:MAG: rhodanese-like domain-containing protein [Pleurocapsa sp.]